MGKNWLRSLKKSKSEAQPIPREQPELAKEYTELCTKLGNAKYSIAYQERVIEGVMKRLSELESEGFARKQLDAAKPAETKEETNEQTRQ
jgi:hypothetical protein